MRSDLPSSISQAESPPASVVHMSAASRGARRRPRAVLRSAVRRLGRVDEWRYVTQRGLAVLPIGANVARYLTESVPTLNGEQPLLAQSLSQGIDGWQKAHAQADKEQHRFLAFIRSVLYPLPEALEWTLSRSDGRQIAVWNPMEQRVMDWWSGQGGAPEAIRRNRPANSAYVALNPADDRLIVLVRFLARDPISLTPLSARLDDLVTRYG